MVDWKLYIESPQKRALDLCFGSFPDGYGYGYGYGHSDGGEDCNDGNGWGDGHDMFYGDGNGTGRSATVW